jgi:hypothetical protein
MGELVPPAFAGPFFTFRGTGIVISDIDVNIKRNIRSIEMEYVEKGIVVEDLDGWVTGPRVS